MERQPIRALIAEDDSLVADVIEHALRAVGVSVVGRAPDGRRAVELTCDLAPDVVLMDVQMPELDGLAAAREIQERCPTAVVVLSVNDDPKTLASAVQTGVGAYLVKPPSPEELLRAMTIARARFADLQELRGVNEELRQALASVKTLSGLLPICSSCKKIRDDRGYWRQVEVYVRDHTQVEFSHSICPECLPKLYPEEEYPELYAPEGEDPQKPTR